MHLLMTIVTMLAMVAVPAGGTAQDAGGALQVDGKPVTRIVGTPPGSEHLAVIAGDTLFVLESGEWRERAGAIPEGEVVWSGHDGGPMLAGNHAPCMRGDASQPLHRSDDGGATWEQVPGVADFRPHAILEDGGLALASSCAGLHLSRDGGLTWEAVPGIEPGWELTSFAVVGDGPVALAGLTGEGGTSYLRSLDFSNPDAPVVSADLRTYYGLGGIAARDDMWVLAGMDGVWASTDGGSTWERRAEGLEGVVLEQDPAIHGLPADFDPATTGLYAVAFLPGERGGVVVGSADGLYLSTATLDRFTRIEDTTGRVDALAVDPSGTLVLYEVDDVVHAVTLPE